MPVKNKLRKTNHRKKTRKIVLGSVTGSLIICVAIFSYWYFSFKTPNLPNPPLKDLAAQHGIMLGEQVALNRLSNKPYVNIVTSQFSFLTIDGDSSWFNFHPSPTTYNYTTADKLVVFAKAHNMPIEMHHLVWGDSISLPDWLKNGHYSSTQLLNIMHQYIGNVAGHYKSEVAVWSVVNEPFTRAQHINGLSDWWADNIGSESYIDDAFTWAHQADPNAKLIVNDFENETENGVSNAEYSFVKTALAKGVPIQGIGMEMHINAADPPSVSAMILNMQRFAAIGLPTYITEFDVNLNYVKGSNAYKNNLEAQITYNVVRACIESKSCISFDNFGISDKENLFKSLFNTNSHSYLFTSRYVPKSSYYSFREAWEQP